MEKIKKWLRLLGLIVLIMLACCGIGFTGLLPRNREQDIENEIKTEITEGKDAELSVKE